MFIPISVYSLVFLNIVKYDFPREYVPTFSFVYDEGLRLTQNERPGNVLISSIKKVHETEENKYRNKGNLLQQISNTTIQLDKRIRFPLKEKMTK